jgi:cbb3-type cytochrome oxidase subunit 3
MSRIFFVWFLLLALCGSAWAQDDRKKSAAHQEAQNIVLQARQQQRRDMLREALKSQVEEAPVPVRQMTTQEKAELRQQLRQQRQDLIKQEHP